MKNKVNTLLRNANSLTDYTKIVDLIVDDGARLTIDKYIEIGKNIIYEYQYARICMDDILMNKAVKLRRKFELWLYDTLDEDDACKYYYAIR